MKNVYLCCQPDILKYMNDYLQSIISNSKLKLLIINTNNYQYNEHDTYVFIQKIPEKMLNGHYQNKIFLLNTEQCTRDEYKAYINNLADRNIGLIDYSIENISCINNKNIINIPYQYNDTEIDKLKKFNSTIEKKYDVVFLGLLSQKRHHIYSNLEKRGIKMLNVNGKWNDDRDISVYSAKILLNVHFADDYNIYEAFRCDRLIFSGMIVVSEKSIANDTLDINELVIFEDYDKLVDKVIDIIKNYDIYYKNFIDKYNKHIDKIKNDRLNNLKQFETDIQ